MISLVEHQLAFTLGIKAYQALRIPKIMDLRQGSCASFMYTDHCLRAAKTPMSPITSSKIELVPNNKAVVVKLPAYSSSQEGFEHAYCTYNSKTQGLIYIFFAGNRSSDFWEILLK